MAQQRRLEYFEDLLWDSIQGRKVVQIVEVHGAEVMRLINKNRDVMVVWQRNKGPEFARSFMDSGFEKCDYQKEIDGTSIDMLLLNLAAAMQESATSDLREAIGQYAAEIILAVTTFGSADEIINHINNK